MNFQEPLRTHNVDFSKIVYPKFRSNQNKKIVLIKYNDKNKLKNFVFQTPTLLNLNTPQFTNGYAEIEVGLVGKENDKVAKFIKFLNDLENKVKQDAQVNASTWFNITEDNQAINFQKIIRESDNFATGTIKIKIIKNNDFETLVQLNNNKRISAETIPADSWCKMILECYAVWINANNDFGLFFRPVLVSFTPKEKEIYNYKFLEESENEDENEFDIPDTDVNNNIFMKVDAKNKNKLKTNDSTSQLDLNELVQQLESEEHQPTSEMKLSIINVPGINLFKNDNILDINIKDNHFSESSSSNNSENSDNSDSEESSNNALVDAETSDN